MFTCAGGFSDYFTIISIVYDEDIGDDNEKKGAVGVEGAAEDDVGIGGFGFGLN